VQNHDDRFSCVVAEEADVTPCTADRAESRPAGRSQPHAVVERSASDCGVIDQAPKYSAARQHDTDCTAFVETVDAEAPTATNVGSPGFLARLKSQV
jgi:hypothetical protein